MDRPVNSRKKNNKNNKYEFHVFQILYVNYLFAIKQSVKIIIIFINIKKETNKKFYGVFEILSSKVSER